MHWLPTSLLCYHWLCIVAPSYVVTCFGYGNEVCVCSSNSPSLVLAFHILLWLIVFEFHIALCLAYGFHTGYHRLFSFGRDRIPRSVRTASRLDEPHPLRVAKMASLSVAGTSGLLDLSSPLTDVRVIDSGQPTDISVSSHEPSALCRYTSPVFPGSTDVLPPVEPWMGE